MAPTKSMLAGAATFAVAGCIGAAVAWFGVGKTGNPAGQGPWSWRTSAHTGEASAGLLRRAVIARVGIWALPPSEVVYFAAQTDTDGKPLSRRCTYEIAGTGDAPARWWSISLYRDHFWVDNPLDRYSFSKTTVARNPDGSWKIMISATPQPGNWIPMGPKDGRFALSYRLYQPQPSVSAQPKAVPLPAVRRQTCA